MADMSFEESLLLQVMRGIQQVQLDVVVIGNAAAALHGVPVTTQDIDLFLRDTPRNAEKIQQLLGALGGNVVASRPFEPTSRMIRIEGLPVDIDLIFELSSHETFESIRARAAIVTIEGVPLRVANLRDVIEAKRAAGRPKDQASLPLLEQFLRIKQAMDTEPI
jgi:predicted nucleotidyltransferase